MSEREKNVGWVYSEGHESPKGVTQRSNVSAHGDVRLRDEAANSTCGAELRAQFAESTQLEQTIKTNLKGLGYAL